MLKHPFFSIVIPAYNAAPYLEETVRAVLAQTHHSLEVIVADDGSIDGTAAIAKKLATEDTRVRYEYQSNKGQSAARNLGLAHAQGEFVSFLDADNILLPHACEIVAQAIKGNPGIDVFYGDLRYFNARDPKKLMKFSLHYFPKVTLETLIEHNFLNLLGTFIRRSTLHAVGGFKNSFRRSDDHYLWLVLLLHGARFSYIDRVLGHLRFHDSNLSFQGTYLRETADTNLLMFEWLAGEVGKRWGGAEREKLLGKIKAARRTWVLKGCVGSLIMQNKEEAFRSLRAWNGIKASPLTYAMLRFVIFAVPAPLLAFMLTKFRRLMIMKKYAYA